MSQKTGANSVPGLQGLFYIGDAGAFGITEQVKVRDAGVPNVAVASEQAGADSVVQVIESFGADGSVIRVFVSIGVGQHADAITLLIIIRDAFALMARHVGIPFGNGLTGQFFIQ